MDNNFIEDILKEQASKDEAAAKSIEVIKEVPLNLDLGHLAVFDTNIIDVKTLKSQPDLQLEKLTRDNTQIFINKIWELDTDRIDGSVIAKLPEAITALPRFRRIPEPKAPTKWELFAKKKGIQKKRRDQVWDEEAKQFRPRYGFKSKQNQAEKEWVVEVKGDEVQDDPFGKQKKDKKERVAKNELRRLQNIARASGKKFGNNKDGVQPAEAFQTQRPERKELEKAAFLAKASTASLGKFQEKADNEKSMKGTGGKKRHFEPNETVKGEKEKNLKLVQEILTSKPKLNVKKAVTNEELAQQKRNQSDPKKKRMLGRGGASKGGKPKSFDRKGGKNKSPKTRK
jgi:regulator of ribosome biosynthesis